MKRLYALLCFFMCVAISSYGQFTVNHSATQISNTTQSRCFQLTPSVPTSKGSVFNNTLINLNQNFEVNTTLYFGALDEGADGLAFVLQAEGVNYIGNDGAGIGYHRFPWDVPGPVPSFIIEFDTYMNGFIAGENIADPVSDHVGFMSMSNAYHTSPTALKAPESFGVNIEDGKFHDARFTWNATTKTMTVVVTLSTAPLLTQTFTYTGDIVNTIFGGNPMVYWGFTASTGGAFSSAPPNEHKVCIVTPPPPPPPPPPADCGQLRTQTPGGWGAPPRGNNPASYMYSKFAAAFPSGLTVGVVPNYNIRLTSAQAVTNFLPSGGQARKLTQNYLNPASAQVKNVLAGHLVALTLSVRFDDVDPNFAPGGVRLGDMIIGSGPFDGWTVRAFLAEANRVLGGAASSFTVQQVLDTASAINENNVDGKGDNGYLDCPEPPRRPAPDYIVKEVPLSGNTRVWPNPTTGIFQLQLDKNATGKVSIVILNSSGAVIETRNLLVGNTTETIRLDLSQKGKGMYLVKIRSANGEQTQKIVVH